MDTLNFTEENYQNVLKSLGFTEQRNPNGKNCWDVSNEKGTPLWQYESDVEQETLYWFFTGMAYQQVRERFSRK